MKKIDYWTHLINDLSNMLKDGGEDSVLSGILPILKKVKVDNESLINTLKDAQLALIYVMWCAEDGYKSKKISEGDYEDIKCACESFIENFNTIIGLEKYMEEKKWLN